MNDREDVIVGSGNFFVDQRIVDPDEFWVKSHLCHEIATTAEQRGLSAADLAGPTSEKAEDVEFILRSRHDGFEVWRLIKVLTVLAADVGITVVPDSGHDRGVVLMETVREA